LPLAHENCILRRSRTLQSYKSGKSTFGSKYRRYFFDDCCRVE